MEYCQPEKITSVLVSRVLLGLVLQIWLTTHVTEINIHSSRWYHMVSIDCHGLKPPGTQDSLSDIPRAYRLPLRSLARPKLSLSFSECGQPWVNLLTFIMWPVSLPSYLHLKTKDKIIPSSKMLYWFKCLVKQHRSRASFKDYSNSTNSLRNTSVQSRDTFLRMSYSSFIVLFIFAFSL